MILRWWRRGKVGGCQILKNKKCIINDVLYKADLTGDEIASHEEQRVFKQNLLPDDWSNSQKQIFDLQLFLENCILKISKYKSSINES